MISFSSKPANIYDVIELLFPRPGEGVFRWWKPGRVPGGTMAGPGDVIHARVGPLLYGPVDHITLDKGFLTYKEST